MLCDGNGCEESFLGGRRVPLIALEQDLAADAMGVGFTPALTGAFCQSDSVIDGRKRRIDLARFSFRLRKGRLKQCRICLLYTSPSPRD